MLPLFGDVESIQTFCSICPRDDRIFSSVFFHQFPDAGAGLLMLVLCRNSSKTK